MKLHLKIKRLVLMSIVICLMCSNFAYAAEDDTITVDDALQLALFHYIGNAGAEQTIAIDRYILTELYDKDGEITYYCFDFLNGTEEKGYSLIAADLSAVICPELAYEGSSQYLLDEQEGITTIYYSPLEFYNAESTETDSIRQKTPKHRRNKRYYDANKATEIGYDDIDGKIMSGDKKANRQLLNAVNSNKETRSAPSVSLLGDYVFTVHPATYLKNNGFTNVTNKTYGTIESGMSNSMNLMYTSRKTLSDGTVLTNMNHCAITAMANVMLYWRPICCSKYPSTYSAMFDQVCITARNLGAFNPTGSSGVYTDDYAKVLLNVNGKYGYYGRVVQMERANYAFVTEYIERYTWPVLLGFWDVSGSSFYYNCHAVVAFGFNEFTCSFKSSSYTYKFIKVTDGWHATPRYISWDAVISNGYTVSGAAFCPYQ